MQGTISFMPDGADPADAAGRHRAACAAMHRYIPHVVAWECLRPGAPFSLVLPNSLSAREVVQHAARDDVELAAAREASVPDRVLEIHYAHLVEAEIEEGLRRLGRCLVRYLILAARSTSEPVVGP